MILGQRCFTFILLIAALASLSCDDEGDNFLDGSLVKNYHISYQSVRARLYTDSLTIEYLGKTGAVALRITIDSTQAILKEGKSYDLAEYGSVTRSDSFGTLPELDSGQLTLESFSEKDGSIVSGKFNGKFIGESGSTQTLRGAFKATMQVVDL